MNGWEMLAGVGAIAAAAVAVWQAVVARGAARDAKKSADKANEAASESNRLNRQIVKLQRAEQHRAIGQFVVDEAGDSAFTVLNPGPTKVKSVKVSCYGFANYTALWEYANLNEPKRFTLKNKADGFDTVELDWTDANGSRQSQRVLASEIWSHLADS